MPRLTVEEALEIGFGGLNDVVSFHTEQMVSGEGKPEEAARFMAEFAAAINTADSVPHALAVACAVVNQFFMDTGLLVSSNGTEIKVVLVDVPPENRELAINQLLG